MSLANSFDVKDPQDLLRALSNALNEYDQNKDDGERPKMVRPPSYYRSLGIALDSRPRDENTSVAPA